MRVLSVVLLLLLLALQYPVWFAEDGSWRDVWRTDSALLAKRAANEKLRIRNEALAAEVYDLKQGTEAIEERARTELGLIKADETFFQVLVKTPPEPKLVVLPSKVATAGRPLEVPAPPASAASGASIASDARSMEPVLREHAKPKPRSRPVVISPPVDDRRAEQPSSEQGNDLPIIDDASPPPEPEPDTP